MAICENQQLISRRLAVEEDDPWDAENERRLAGRAGVDDVMTLVQDGPFINLDADGDFFIIADDLLPEDPPSPANVFTIPQETQSDTSLAYSCITTTGTDGVRITTARDQSEGSITVQWPSNVDGETIQNFRLSRQTLPHG